MPTRFCGVTQLTSSPQPRPGWSQKLDDPATRTLAPACTAEPRGFAIDAAVHLQIALGLSAIDQLPYATDLGESRMEEMLMPEAGSTVMTSTWSTSGRISTSTSAGVAGLIATPARFPRSRMLCTVRCRLKLPSQWTRNESEPASANSWRNGPDS